MVHERPSSHHLVITLEVFRFISGNSDAGSESSLTLCASCLKVSPSYHYSSLLYFKPYIRGYHKHILIKEKNHTDQQPVFGVCKFYAKLSGSPNTDVFCQRYWHNSNAFRNEAVKHQETARQTQHLQLHLVIFYQDVERRRIVCLTAAYILRHISSLVAVEYQREMEFNLFLIVPIFSSICHPDSLQSEGRKLFAHILNTCSSSHLSCLVYIFTRVIEFFFIFSIVIHIYPYVLCYIQGIVYILSGRMKSKKNCIRCSFSNCLK